MHQLLPPPILGWWVHDIDPFIIRFPEGFFSEGIRWYGFAYLLGFAAGALLLHLYYKKGKSPLDGDQQTTLITALMIGVIAGGRLGYLILYDFNGFLQNPLIFFKVWQGGMASHGGFLGVFIACVWFSKKNKIPLLQLCDLIATLVPPGLFFGRIANFINGYLWGNISYVPWAIIFPNSAPPGTPIDLIPPRHPSQLYEAGLEGLLLFFYTQWRIWKGDIKNSPGRLSGEFLIGYSILRIFCEIFRAPDADLITGLSRGQFYSLFTLMGGIAFFYFSFTKKDSSK